MNQLKDKTALVAGASRGLGRGVAEAFAAAGASLIAVARDTGSLADLSAHNQLVQLENADASDPVVAGRLLDQYHPDIIALIAGTAFVQLAVGGPDADAAAYTLTAEGLRPLTESSI